MKPVYITDYLERNAASYPKKPAIVFNETRHTWQELYADVERTAQRILQLVGSTRGQEIVGLLLPNSYDFVVSYLAIIHAGHIAMPLDPNFKPAETKQVVSQMKPRLVVSSESYGTHFSSKSDWLAVSELVSGAAKVRLPLLRTSPEHQAASMLFTSGTTGKPKAVPYSHANHMWNPSVVSSLWKWTHDDTILLSLPLSHWHGLVMGIDGALYHGNTIYLQERFDAGETVAMLQSGKISLFMHVPIAYSKLVEYAEGKKVDISSVRLCIAGSSYLPPSLWQQFKQAYGMEILERYGANEMGLLTSNTLDARIPGCVGNLLPGVEVRIEPDGEIAMRSPGLFAGYWHNVEATQKQQTEDGYWLSGDIGEFDDSGKLHLKGRVQEKMKKFGYTVYPRDVEWALTKLQGVDEAVVMSVQQEDSLSDDFVYFIVGSATDEQIHAYAKTDMPSFWRPDRIVHLQEIPRTGRTSKPSIAALKQLLG